jgi:hypothetical protein
VSSFLPILLFGLGGILLGGAYSMRKQGAGTAPVVILLVFSLLAVASGVLWLFGRS